MLKLIVLLAILVVCTSASRAEDAPLSIKSGSIAASYHPSSGTLILRDLPSGRVFVPSGKLTGTGGTARLAKITDPDFGQGQAIEISCADGNKDTIALYPKLPFVLLRTGLHNGGTEQKVVNRVETFTASLDLGKPASELSIVGTGGMRKATTELGSYEWIAVAQPVTRRGVVAGWLTHDRACGVLLSREQGRKVQLTARSDYGRLRIHPGKTENLETLAIGYFDDARVGLEAWADAVAKVYNIKLPPMPVGYCTWYVAGASNEKDIARDAAIAAEKLAPFGFTFMQIDDGWQDGLSRNGPRKNFARARKDGPYPSGMKVTADAISATGLTPGIWFMPFAGTFDDPWFKDHQDWFIKREDGRPYDVGWTGTCLDMTNPDVQQYVRDEVKRIAKDWGYRYFKMDGLHAATGTKQTYANMFYTEDGFGDAVFKDPDKTNIEAHRGGLKLVRETAGKDVFLLGCCCPQNMRSYGASFGLVDAMRIGPDNGGNWNGWLTSPGACSAHYFVNGRIWYNDPDPVYVNERFSLDQARAACSWQAITGQFTVFSDAIANLPAERIDILRRIMPTHRATARPVDLFENDRPRIWLVTDTKRAPRRDVIGLFNWTNEPIQCDYDMGYIGLSADTEYVAYDYWNNVLFTIKGKLSLPLGPTSCRVLAVRPLLDRPMLLSTSRHVTQGIVDVLEEQWQANSKTLGGRSLVVANDRYELRIVARSSKVTWMLERVSVSQADDEKGVKIDVARGSDGLWRVTINSPVSREVAWSVKFTEI